MNAPSVDIATMIQNAGGDWDESDWGYPDWLTGLGEIGAAIYVGREPSTPNNCVTIFDTVGGGNALTLDNEGDDYEYCAVQVRIRNTDYRKGWFMAEAIKDTLHGRANYTWSGALYTVIRCSNGPVLLEWDNNNRVKFIINFEIQRRST